MQIKNLFMVLNVVALIGLPACFEEGESNGSARRSLASASRSYRGKVSQRERAQNASTAGLWLTVCNDLPVIRQDDKIISQTFIEAEIEARDRHETPSQQRHEEALRHREGGAEGLIADPSEGGDDSDGQAAERPIYQPLRFMLEGRVLSETCSSFWLEPERVDALVAKSGGPVRLNIRDSVQLASYPYYCSPDSPDGEVVLRLSSEQAVQELTFKVMARRKLSFRCQVK